MAIIRNRPPQKAFSKIENKIIFDMELSHAAYRLYSLMILLKSGKQCTDAYFAKVMGISDKSLKKYKKELIDKDYILVDRAGPRLYFLYVGYSELPASEVKASWEESDKETNV